MVGKPKDVDSSKDDDDPKKGLNIKTILRNKPQQHPLKDLFKRD
jgi:hypothetical protein